MRPVYQPTFSPSWFCRTCSASLSTSAGSPSPPHKSHTCYRVFRIMNQCRQCLCRQVMSPIRPQELTMAARTVTRTTRHVDGKGHLIGELLKNNICIYIMKHFYLTLNDKTHSRSRGYIHPHNSVSHSIERTTIWPTKI